MSNRITQQDVNEKLAKLSDLTGLNFWAQYYNGFCHIVYDFPTGGIEAVAAGTKREMYDFAYAMIMGVLIYEENRKN